MRHRIFSLVLLLSFLPGCWDLQEIDRRAFTTTIGIDLTDRELVELILQIPLPQRMLPPGSQGGKETSKVFGTIQITGRTVNEAFARLQTRTYRELVVQQNKSIIIGKLPARKGVGPYIDHLLRESKAPPQALIYIARRPVGKILSFAPIQGTLPGLQFFETSQNIVKYDRTYFVPIWFFAQRLTQRSKDAYAPLLDLERDHGHYIQAGLAVFDGDRMVGELNEEEAQIFGLLTGRMKAGSLTFILPDGVGLTCRNTRGTTRVKVRWNAASPAVAVDMKISCSISELAGGSQKQPSLSYVRHLERIVAARIRQRTSAVLAKLQKLGSDPVGFGEQLRIQHPKVWASIDWKRIYPRVRFLVHTQALILTDGVLK